MLDFETFIHLWCNCKITPSLWETGSFFHVNHTFSIWPSNSTFRYLPKRMKINICVKTCVWMLVVVLFIIVKNCKRIYKLTNRKTNSTSNNIHVTRYYSAIKRNKLLIHLIIWMDLKSSKNAKNKSQTQKYILNNFLYMELWKWQIQ